MAVTITNGVWKGIAWKSGWIGETVTWLADRAWYGVRCLVDRVWTGGKWLAARVWNGLTWMVERAWNGVTWMVDWISHGLVWMTERAWDGLAWIGKLFLPGNYVTDAVVKFYNGYLDKHVKHVKAGIAVATWQDVFYIMCAVIAVNFALLAIYLLVKSTLNFIRRLWKARKDRIAAANLPPAPNKPIWRPKPKKKHKNKNKNKW
ncbi:hypothetical protein ACROYT_G021693 [Oculina patagonica]